MASERIQRYIKMNQEIRARFTSGRIHPEAQKIVTATTADQTFSNNLLRESRTLASTKDVPVFEQLYNIPEVAVCVDFWVSNIGTRAIMPTSKNQKFVDALIRYLSFYEQIPGYTFLSMFNSNAKDYVFHGNEVYFVDTRLTEVDGFKFPKKIIPIPYTESGLDGEAVFPDGVEYTAEYLDVALDSKKILVCKRMAKPMDVFGVSVIERVVRPVSQAISDSELDASVSRMGVLSSFVLVKYGTEENPRTDDDIEELHTELQANMEQGIAFGVVPPDVSVESLFKSSNASSFNRDKIYETYIESVDVAFGGVINTLRPKSNAGGGSDKSLIMLRNILNAEREVRRSQIIVPIINKIKKMNGLEDDVVVELTDIDLVIETLQDAKLKEFDRGIMSTETYLEDKFQSELVKIKKEIDEYKQFIVPRDLSYTKSGSSSDQNQTQ